MRTSPTDSERVALSGAVDALPVELGAFGVLTDRLLEIGKIDPVGNGHHLEYGYLGLDGPTDDQSRGRFAQK